MCHRPSRSTTFGKALLPKRRVRRRHRHRHYFWKRTLTICISPIWDTLDFLWKRVRPLLSWTHGSHHPAHLMLRGSRCHAITTWHRWYMRSFATPVERPIWYVSHEHRDHLDIDFLNGLPVRRFTLLLPAFSRSALGSQFSSYQCQQLVFFQHRQQIPIPGGYLRFYVDDSQLNRDSAVLLRNGDTAFLNLNDCKLFDTLPEIVAENGPVKIFACQFSGATWHPTCYEYERGKYESISKKKSLAKFESVAKAIDLIRPAVYIPSAGPVCFLDPMLQHLNDEPVNIFPRAAKVIDYFKRRLPAGRTYVPEMMPGDILDADLCVVTELAEQRVEERNVVEYIADYAKDYKAFFEERAFSTQMRQRICDGRGVASRVGVQARSFESGRPSRRSALRQIRFLRRLHAPRGFPPQGRRVCF